MTLNLVFFGLCTPPYTLKQLKNSSFTTQNSAIPESFGGPNSFKTFPTVELRIYEASLIFITE